MTTRPELKLGRHLLPGLVAVLLFAVMAFVFLQTGFGGADGFPERTEVANVSVGEAGTNVSAMECDGAIYAVDGNSCEDRVERVTNYTEASVGFETHGNTVYGVATIDTSVTESIGYALINLNPFEGEGHSRAGIPTEGFLVALILMAVLLDAALEASLMLAKREDERGTVTALETDGGDRGGDN